MQQAVFLSPIDIEKALAYARAFSVKFVPAEQVKCSFGAGNTPAAREGIYTNLLSKH